MGFSRSGKSALILNLLDLLQARGVRTGVVKHHAGILSPPHKDSTRFSAKAPTVLVADDAILEMAARPPLEDALERLPGGLDLVLIEGFKSAKGPKVWVGKDCPPSLDGLLAVVGGEGAEGVPRIERDDALAVFETVLRPLLEGTDQP